MPALARALDVARSAARVAADHLRAEFFRPGGPRGEPGHCPADAEAEDLVRDLLEAEFPDHGIVAEERPERDRRPRDLPAHTWVIDPNDGTADFQRGLRGASVSIALLRGGVPVLGVVLAHTAPEGGEDLVFWAEGEGPVIRNGEAVPPLPDAPLARGDVVVVSSSAARRVLANARACWPAAFRPMTSIAYRLALVAVGSAQGAMSLHRPRALDIAAGHALVRGAGGVLLDEEGREVRYGPDGSGGVRFCFAGSRARAAALARADWSAAESGPSEPVPLAFPVRGGALADDALLRRAQGALLGQLAGDALGSLVEFQGPHEIAALYPEGVRDLADGGTWDTIAGQPTDDSELALALARALLDGDGVDTGRVAAAYADWYRSAPFDVGSSTRAALSAAARTRVAGGDGGAIASAARTAARRDTEANGALMRISPLGVRGHAAPEEALATWAREDARLTHPTAVCQDASAVLAGAIAFAVRTGAGAAEVAAEADRLADALGAAAPVRAALAAARAGTLPDFTTDAGHVIVALQNAFARLRGGAPLEDALVATVGAGGDTDTNAAIAGALLGAVQGVAAVPHRWRWTVLSCWPKDGAPGVKRPRPAVYWPVDALVLAERLATVK